MLYLPYGEVWIDEGSDPFKLGYKFTGKEMDEETGLSYFGARYYDPQMSSWISTDPALDKYFPQADQVYFPQKLLKPYKDLQGMGGVFNTVNNNLYHYGALNPNKYVDPNGEKNYLVISLFQGGGSENVGSSFIDAANTHAADIKKGPNYNSKTDTVNVVHLNTLADFYEVINKGDIDQLDIFGHGGPRHLVVGKGKGPGERGMLTTDNISKLKKNALNPGARVTLFACKTASEKSLSLWTKLWGGDTIAEDLADHFKGSKVTGFTSGALFGPKKDSKVDPKFKHKKGGKVYMIPWGTNKTYENTD